MSERDEDRCSSCGAELEEPQPQGAFPMCLSCEYEEDEYEYKESRDHE